MLERFIYLVISLLLLRGTLSFGQDFPRQQSATTPSETISDIDRYIRGLEALRPNPQRWAVIIGIEKYQRTVAASYARRDAQSVKEYAQKLLEVPQENIFLLLDEEATKTTLQVLLEERLPRRLKPEDQLFVYYAGHGLADPRTGQPYFLPSDADPQSIQLSGYSAEAFYGALGRLKEQRVVVFLDACFSGIVGRQEKIEPLLLAARPLALTVEDPALKHKNITVLAAAQHDQLSNSDPESGHGLFTYHLLRGLVGEADSNGDGRVRLAELASYVKDAVDRKSRQLYGQTRDQTPVLIPAKLRPGQDIELTSRTGKIPPAKEPPVATPIPPPPVADKVIGPYEVLYPTFVYSEPREDSRRVAKVEAGTKIDVVDVQGNWLKVQSKRGNPPGFIKKDSAVPLLSRAEEPPVIARPKPPEPLPPPARLKPFQEFREIRVEVESLRLLRSGQAMLYLRFYNKTNQDLAVIAALNNAGDPSLVDNTGIAYQWGTIRGMGMRGGSQDTRLSDWLILPAGQSGTASVNLYAGREAASSTSNFSFTGEFQIFPKDRLISIMDTGRQGYIRPTSLGVSLHNIRVE